MTQMNLFPPPGAVGESLPLDVLHEAARALAELLVGVVENSTEKPAEGRGDHHE
jgi:hypothetical protein